ncbi:MAG TPA: ATP-dependent DNA helicase [Candidatus Paceibacterota bacterium]|nr:ATP-dependent DNA helicase [Candidatus Paceibacterota bacterium]
MPQTPFAREYKALNPRQKEAVDAVEGPVMVIAGPGTGKTQVLTLRIANILKKTDAEPRSILALTFTEKAAFNMRDRLAGLIGQEAYGVRIGTFHAFCNEVIGRYPDSFPDIIGGTAITDAEQLGVVEAILESEDVPSLRPAGRPESYVRAIIGALGDVKGKGYAPAEFAKAVKSASPKGKTKDTQARQAKRMTELARVYARYEKELSATNRYDFADMLVRVASALEKDRDLRLDLAEQYQYVLVDEHQDTNRVQNAIVRHITESSGDAPNLFVVGDLEQAIYRFQGASPENFRDFGKRYPDCRVIRLDENYRSSQAILDAAMGISPGQGALKAKAGHADDAAELYAFSSPGAMEFGIAKLAADAIQQGTPPDRIAVLYRTNREADGLQSALERLGVPFAVQSDLQVLGDREVGKLLAVAKAARSIGDDAALVDALHVDLLKVSPLDIARIGRTARDTGVSAWDLLRSPARLKRLDAEDPAALSAAYAMLRDLAVSIRNKDATSALQEVVDRTGWVSHAASHPYGNELIAKLHALFDAVRAFLASEHRATLADFLDALERLDAHNVDLAALSQPRPDAVQLMTAHKAKGLEFDVVFVAHAVRGHWDDARKPPRLPLPDDLADDDPGADEDDIRRLFYVAVSRARKRLVLAWPQRTADGKDLQPSRFVLSIPEHLRRDMDTSSLESEYAGHMAARTGRRRSEPVLRQKAFIADLLAKQPLSVSALNNFLACPWRYYFLNLVRYPEAPGPKGEYGTAAHEALRRVFARPEKPFTKADLIGAFRTALSRAALSEKMREQLERQGAESLSGWFDAYEGSWHRNVRTEYAVERVQLDPDIALTGKLDKVELMDGNTVSVVDYKTKAPMSANAIRGLTKSDTGNEWRQLLFYKLLLDLDGKWNMTGGQIDFLEPNASGRYKKEAFAVTPDMTGDLKTLIRDMYGRVRVLEFWNDRCDERDCRYCAIRDRME